jgi:hypothetical protein
VGDASTDGTAHEVHRIAESDDRLRLHVCLSIRDPALPETWLFPKAVGDRVALLDSDDNFDADRLTKLLALGEANQADMVSENVLLCPEDGSAPPTPMIPYAVSARPPTPVRRRIRRGQHR